MVSGQVVIRYSRSKSGRMEKLVLNVEVRQCNHHLCVVLKLPSSVTPDCNFILKIETSVHRSNIDGHQM